MGLKDYIEIVKEILGKTSTQEKTGWEKIVNPTNKNGDIFLDKKAYGAYITILDEMYKDLKIESYEISLNWFKLKIEYLFFMNLLSVEELWNNIKDAPKKSYVYAKPIYGIEFDFMKRISFGNLTLVCVDDLFNAMGEKTKNVNIHNESNKEELRDDDYYIVGEYKCKDKWFGEKIFENDCMDVVHFIRYMIATRKVPTGVTLSFVFPEYNRIYCIGETGEFEIGSVLNNNYPDIGLEQGLDTDYQKLYDYIYENNNDMSKHIKTAIRWVSKSIDEVDYDVACTELAFAYECVFKYNTEAMINPSIQGQISETLAILVGKDYEERKCIIRDFLDFYKFRCAVAHGGDPKKKTDYEKMLSYLQKGIFAIVLDDNYSKCKNPEELRVKIEEYKYRG